MKIIKIKPQGFCKGVIYAINIVEKTLNDKNVKKPIYMLGNIVHNKNIVNSFRKKGIIVLEGQSREEMIEQVQSGTVIITAHGACNKIKTRAKEKGLTVIDATCRNVDRTHQLIKDKLDNGYIVYYYGKEKHPETEGVLGISSDITLITENTDLTLIPKNKGKAFLTNQTTMSYFDVYQIYEKLKQIIPKLELGEEVCSATRRRQEAVLLYRETIDLCIVVGDALSNNTKKLKEVAEKNGINAIQIEDASQLAYYDLSDYKTVGVTAGASTPNDIVDEVIAVLKMKENTSN
ncbi:MAG: 4-hydroxy-3-methylbut-2-enyl diphosphate reductase [Bacilli bacterium]|nr:4-hydroxy-3-methylbut-2-enyl diphosphate reductase [Bacilli bacterium]MDD4076877.1 4-hydroxy-3-methylbut-2-enyl diphosphate reductase [Bacilli bacterium]MDD4388121.1 4-hydroxy-3-methylbut-2-enyl diphosphate reductase [Bacilli bacterium]